MNQRITAEGPYCGYSFDHILVADEQQDPPVHGLHTDTFHPRATVGGIPYDELELLKRVEIAGRHWSVYRVDCSRALSFRTQISAR
jgi:hypothetical protein